jgi:NTP pyrophosphatase (non-canonical NTP hydrolase)
MNEKTREILLILQEECAEVTQAISKCFRFGPDQMKPGKDRTNISMLQEELGDLLAMIELLTKQDVGVSEVGLIDAKIAKFKKLKQWSNIFEGDPV